MWHRFLGVFVIIYDQFFGVFPSIVTLTVTSLMMIHVTIENIISKDLHWESMVAVRDMGIIMPTKCRHAVRWQAGGKPHAQVLQGSSQLQILSFGKYVR
jgi:ABC-type uncharacterized transport system permease subunit